MIFFRRAELQASPLKDSNKHRAEAEFWRHEIDRYAQWYRGEIPKLYNTPSPSDREREQARLIEDSAVLTWLRLHQQPKYLFDLQLLPDQFAGMTLLDIGSGPMPSATCFAGADLYCLDPLFPAYLEAGFPLHYYGNVKFVHGFSERIPIDDAFFDAVISVNAIDHVDDLTETAAEIRRVLKTDGLLALHTHYHPPTETEPLALGDRLIERLFDWSPRFQKKSELRMSFTGAAREGDSFVLWKNF